MRRAALPETAVRPIFLPGDRGTRPDDAVGWFVRQHGQAELAAFERRLQTERGLAPSTALTLRRQLQGAVAAAGLPGPSPFVQDPDRVVAGIQRLATRGARCTLHRAIGYFLAMSAETLPPDTAVRVEAALDAFPGRVAPKPHLVDRELGGSVKRVRPAPPFTAGNAERLCRIVEDSASSARRARDGALVALNCWSGFAPGYFVELRWEAVLPALASDDRFPRVPFRIKGRPFPIVVDRRAVTALERYWRASGEPARGVIFLQANRSRRPVTVDYMSRAVAGYLAAAGLRGVDRRRLNAPFARALLDRGWDPKAVTDAFGYQRVATLREHVRPVEEAQAQLRSVEWLTAQPSRAEIDSIGGGMPRDPLSPRRTTGRPPGDAMSGDAALGRAGP